MNPYVEEFLKIEKEKNLFAKRIDGVNIWPYLRLEVFRLIERQLISSDMTPVYVSHRLSQIGKTCSIDEYEKYVDDFCEKRKGCDAIVINKRHRLVWKNKKPFCPITGMIEDILLRRKISTISLSYLNDENDIKTGNELCFEKALKVPVLFDQKSKEKYVEYLTEIFSSGFGIQLGATFANDVIGQIDYIFDCFSYGDFFRKVFEKINPKAIFVSSYYETLIMVILKEANMLKIPTIELQHGIIGDEHIAYNSLVPSTENCYPKYMMVYGRFEKNIMRSFVPVDRRIVSGNQFLEDRIRTYTNTMTKDMALIVGFSSQNEGMINFAIDLARNTKLEVVFRVHPEFKDKDHAKERLLAEGVSVSDDFKDSIYDFVEKAKYVVSTQSTVLLEAQKFGKQVFVLDDLPESKQNLSFLHNIPRIKSFQDMFDKYSEISEEDNINKACYIYESISQEQYQNILELMLEGKDILE